MSATAGLGTTAVSLVQMYSEMPAYAQTSTKTAFLPVAVCTASVPGAKYGHGSMRIPWDAFLEVGLVRFTRNALG